MKLSSTIKTALMIGLFAASTTVASAGDTCRNVHFQLVNQKDHTITVAAVKYFNRVNNKLQTESIRNIDCRAGATCVTQGDNLRDAEGEDLTRFFFILKNEGGENRHATSAKVPADPQCRAGRVYSFVINAND